MIIANPMSDYVFKYLMSNEKLAKKILSVILDKEVVQLRPAPREITVQTGRGKRRLTQYRMDFRAVLRDASGREEEVMLELQKSKLPTNILRFRSYLGWVYAGQPMQKVKEPAGGVEEAAVAYAPLPIITIYILGYNLRDIPYAAIKVNHRVIDLSTGEEAQVESPDFLDLLTHTTYVIQVQRLPDEVSTPLEQLLTLFDQRRVGPRSFELSVPKPPKDFMDIAQYLQRPLLEEDMLREIIEEEWENMDASAVEALEARLKQREEDVQQASESAKKARRQLREVKKQVEQARQQAEQARQQAEQARQQAEEVKKQAEEAQKQARLNALRLARVLLQSGASIQEAALQSGLSEEDVRRLLSDQ
ncbi:MAG: hypothetical protein NZM41_06270 [Saprospiraceae bacterium]|nr:hypothetical protein [Saprospiraceae bacterium]